MPYLSAFKVQEQVQTSSVQSQRHIAQLRTVYCMAKKEFPQEISQN